MALSDKTSSGLGSWTKPCMPSKSYCDGETTKAISASAALNKWLKAHVSKDIVVHSLRHAMRDRLRAVECPTDIIDQIGGWSRKGFGESYGRGYQVEQLWRWMAKAVG